MLFSTIATGIMAVFKRIFIFIISLIISLARIDRPAFATKLIFSDVGYNLYLTALKIHHYHNNPTTCVFINLLAGSLDKLH